MTFQKTKKKHVCGRISIYSNKTLDFCLEFTVNAYYNSHFFLSHILIRSVTINYNVMLVEMKIHRKKEKFCNI